MESRFKRLPEQEYIVQRYTRPTNAWQRQYMSGRAKGVWVIVCTVKAHSGWEACAAARKDYARWCGDSRLRAIYTWSTKASSLTLAS